VTGLPPGFDLVDLIDDAVNNLEHLGHLELEPDEHPPYCMVTELASLAGECADCASCPGKLAHHHLAMRQHKWEQSLPVWVCDCGTVFKVPPPEWGVQAFYRPAEDGALGEHAGGIKYDSKGRVKDSHDCPVCGRRFADTIADQAAGRSTLF
jgi:hypothetical protein